MGPEFSSAPARPTQSAPSLNEDRKPTPAPTTPTRPTDVELGPVPTRPDGFTIPSRRILSRQDLDLFTASSTHQLITWFVFSLSDSCRATTRSAATKAGDVPVVDALMDVLDLVEGIIKANGADDNAGSRFGNPAFRRFYDALHEPDTIEKLHGRLSGLATEPVSKECMDEISTYLTEAFGNRQRLDYGSGHELNFILWLICLDRLGMITGRTPDDDKHTLAAIALRVFPRYLAVVRTVQLTYYLEPAGSHGVWGLDDYQFLPFLFGAAQLTGPEHRYLRPKSIHSATSIEEAKAEYLYFDQIDWVNETKTVKGIAWHSPMLNDISSAKSWEKIEGGMRKMFLNDLLGKLPIMQHFLFGSIIPAPAGLDEQLEPEVEHDQDGTTNKLTTSRSGKLVLDSHGRPIPVPDHSHSHGPDGCSSSHATDEGGLLGDPCGIKVPSGVAAVMEMRKKRAGELRPLPFD